MKLNVRTKKKLTKIMVTKNKISGTNIHTYALACVCACVVVFLRVIRLCYICIYVYILVCEKMLH